MGNTILLFLFMFSNYLFCQDVNTKATLKFTYDVIRNNEARVSHLLISNKTGFYYNVNNKKQNEYLEEETPKGLSYKIKVNSTDSIKNIVKTDLEAKQILSVENIFIDGEYKKYIIKDTLTFIDWHISNETKEIGDFSCRKAVAKIKGRQYQVWFTDQIPATIGPWKIHGLPGAIIHAHDDDNFINFYLNKIETITSTEAGKFNLNLYKDTTKINCEDYILLKENQGLEVASKIQSKLPRGATFTIDKITKEWLEKDCN